MFALARATSGADERVDFEMLRYRAKLLAEKPYASRVTDIPVSLRKLTYDQYFQIRFREEDTWWRHEPLRNNYGLLQAVLDPYVNAMHVALLRQRRPSVESREWFAQLRQRLLIDGPDRLTAKENMALLLDAESMIWLHRELWRRPSPSLADWWRLAMRQYNVLTATPVTGLYR